MPSRFPSVLTLSTMTLLGCAPEEKTSEDLRGGTLSRIFDRRLVQVQMGFMHADEDSWTTPGLSCSALPGVRIARLDYPTANQTNFRALYGQLQAHNISLMSKDPELRANCSISEPLASGTPRL